MSWRGSPCGWAILAACIEHPFIREFFLGRRGRRALQALPPERRAKLPPAALEPASVEIAL